jgi:hypothetical protein
LKKRPVRKQAKKKTKPSGPTAIGQLIRSVGSLGGGYLGGLVGAPTLGGAAGHQLGAMASKWLGFGDYRVAKNSILTRSSDSIPSMHKEDQSVILRHKEFVGTLTSTTDFTVQYQLPLNPGMSTFPWLSPIACKFQEYRFRGVVFHYIPSSGYAVSGTNSALGNVMFQTTYRSSENVPASKVEMLNEYCANEVVPSDSVIHPIECDPKQNPFSVQYVRSVAIPTGDSLLNYDLGRTFIATQGQQAVGNYLGDIWVTYEVELMKPVVTSNVTMNPMSEIVFSGASSTSFFSTLVSTTDTLGLTFDTRSITFPAGSGTRFAYTLSFTNSNMSYATWNTTTVTNGTLVYARANTIASGSGKIMCSGFVEKTDPSKAMTVTIVPLTFTGTLDALSVNVVRAT